MELIDVNALKWILKHSKTYHEVIALDVVLDVIRCSSTVDIVRCKDCRHCYYYAEDDMYVCRKIPHCLYDASKHYCSYGERRDDE